MNRFSQLIILAGFLAMSAAAQEQAEPARIPRPQRQARRNLSITPNTPPRNRRPHPPTENRDSPKKRNTPATRERKSSAKTILAWR